MPENKNENSQELNKWSYFSNSLLSLLSEAVVDILSETGALTFSSFSVAEGSGAVTSIYALSEGVQAGLFISAGTILGGAIL